MTPESSLNFNLCGLVPLTNEYSKEAHLAKTILNNIDGKTDQKDVFGFNCTSINPSVLLSTEENNVEKMKADNEVLQMCTCEMLKFKETTKPLFECNCLVPNKNNITVFDKTVHNLGTISTNSNTPNIVKKECTFIESIENLNLPKQFLCIPKIEGKQLFQHEIKKTIEQTMNTHPNIRKSETTDLIYKLFKDRVLNSTNEDLLNQNTNVPKGNEISDISNISENSESKQKKPTYQSKETLQMDPENPVLSYSHTLTKASAESLTPKIVLSHSQNQNELVQEETKEKITNHVPARVLSKLDRKTISSQKKKLRRARRAAASSSTPTTPTTSTSNAVTISSTTNSTTNVTSSVTANLTGNSSLTVTPTSIITSFTTKPVNDTDVETINVLIPISVGMFLLVLFILLMKSLTKSRRWKD